jgi:hypothetical protein
MLSLTTTCGHDMKVRKQLNPFKTETRCFPALSSSYPPSVALSWQKLILKVVYVTVIRNSNLWVLQCDEKQTLFFHRTVVGMGSERVI